MERKEIRWIQAARRDFLAFPEDVQRELNLELIEVATGAKPRRAKPIKGLGPGVIEIALKHRGDAWRLVYAIKIGTDIWIIHAFQKKSKSGIATPQKEIETIRARLTHVRSLS